MSNMQPLSVFLSERFTAVAVEIHAVVQKTIAEYQAEVFRSKEEIRRLRMLLQLQRADPQILTLPAVDIRPALSEQEQSLDQKDLKTPQIKLKQEPSQSTSQDHEELGDLQSDIKEFVMFSPLLEKSDHNQDDAALHGYQGYQAPVEENREIHFLPRDSYEHINTESDGEDYGESEPTTSNYCFATQDFSCEGMENGALQKRKRVGKSTVFSKQDHPNPSCKAGLIDVVEAFDKRILLNQITVLEQENKRLKKQNALFRTSMSTSNDTVHPNLVDIGGGIMVSEAALQQIDHTHHRKLTNGLLTLLFSKEELAESSLRGKRCNAHKDDHVKKALDIRRLEPIVGYVMEKCSVEKKYIFKVISAKLNYEDKLSKGLITRRRKLC
ncbi:hypothetical protein UPYG_G00139250 [Umbra pygmaea]|uniref:BEN domain-containing protein n=1 Tax=Umbra pygmaea TaxID=75934 RepID=A0ABD0XJY2_UMBPY